MFCRQQIPSYRARGKRHEIPRGKRHEIPKICGGHLKKEKESYVRKFAKKKNRKHHGKITEFCRCVKVGNLKDRSSMIT